MLSLAKTGSDGLCLGCNQRYCSYNGSKGCYREQTDAKAAFFINQIYYRIKGGEYPCEGNIWNQPNDMIELMIVADNAIAELNNGAK